MIAARNTAARRASGFVLIMALLALALMTILLLALLQGTAPQVRGSLSDASYTREKMLADSAVALVIGQIQQASTQTGQTWISQPGLLRTYDATASRRPTACYKLYSAAQMTDTSGTLDFLATDVPPDWNSTANQGFYTDLNAPQQAPGFLGRTIYPILNPAASKVTGVIIDPSHVEMPVAWLYQLQDGMLGPASLGTKANPIVARLAFWTDDDTCKININTAGCGSAWNTPRANSADDVTWSTTQPAQGEFSRYPGHPAMTSLGVVFDAGSNPLSPQQSQQLLGLTPRYGSGGSEFGTQSTTPGETVPAKTNRLYASLDELSFDTGFTSSGQRQPNSVTPDQIDAARFVLTAHSQAPETTLLGEPRVAIWPVSDAPKDSTRTTSADRAIESAATVGARSYFFQRHDPLDPKDDFNSDPAAMSSSQATSSNVKLFNELVARGDRDLPGYGTHFTQKYPDNPDAKWTQIMLGITDFIRGLNAIDPNPAIVPYASGGFIVPLTTAYLSGGKPTTLRGFGRYPTLSSLTLVLYVSGFEFSGKSKISPIDFDGMDNAKATQLWNTYFDPANPSNHWNDVTSELVRAFVVPCTFQPGCAYPEVSDGCDIKIEGLDQMKINGSQNPFGFQSATPPSHLLGDALTVLPADRAWGGNEGPLAWRAASLDANGNGTPYAFAGTQYFSIPWNPKAEHDPQKALVKKLPWPPTSNMAFNGATGLTVLIGNNKTNPPQILQTLHLNLTPPSKAGPLTVPAPTINGECDHMDDSTSANPDPHWGDSTNTATHVTPAYYMNLRNRLLATQLSRPVFIQAGDISRSVEANTDLRVIAGLGNVPSSMFSPHPNFYLNQADPQGGSHAHNIRFANGTSACFASGAAQLTSASYPPATPVQLMLATDWRDSTGRTTVPYTWMTNPPCSRPTGPPNFVSMLPVQNIFGDWDTGPGFASDGALINLPDAGTTLSPDTAYFSLAGGKVGSPTRQTPNALVPSPVIFGSLPAGIDPVNQAQSEPWRTLLFCPNPAANFCFTSPATVTSSMHPGFATPPDYLLLDNFWMPVVEPYAISTCMATAGKINLNDQIAPFTYLHRNTALHALLHDLRIPAIPVTMGKEYKTRDPNNPKPPMTSIWLPVDEDATIGLIENRFTNGNPVKEDAYLTEGEICTVPLVPKGVTAGDKSLDTLWNGISGTMRLTGDNLRELPYAQLYGRLTTRSNSYTVHVRVQVLQKLPRDPNQNVWNEGIDRVLGDWRGSYEIERYLDPSAQAPAAAPAPLQSLGPYRYRIVSSNRFAP